MRIAFIKQRYVPFGGGEGYLERLMKGCAQEGHSVHLITMDWASGDSAFPLEIHPVKLHYSMRSTKAKAFAAEAAACVAGNNFDVVFSLERTNCQQIWRGGEGVHRIWLDQRTKYESAVRSWWNERSRFQKNMLALERECILNTPFLIANSGMVKRDLLEVFPDLKGEVHVVQNGFDPGQFSIRGRDENRRRIRAEFDIAESARLLLFPGSGFRRKGLTEMLRVMKILPDFTLLVIGRDDTGYWQQLARWLGVSERVRFPAPRRDLCRVYHAVDSTVLPSWYDPFGNVGVESLACGTPLVSTVFTGASELIQPGINGVRISSPAEIEELANAIRQAVNISGGAAVAETVKNNSIEQNIKQTLRIVSKAAARE